MTEGEDDVLLWDALAHEIFRDPKIRSIVLEPDLAVDDIQVDEDLVDTPFPFPADLAELVMALRIVANEFRADILV
jgi:hypothetical protein